MNREQWDMSPPPVKMEDVESCFSFLGESAISKNPPKSSTKTNSLIPNEYVIAFRMDLSISQQVERFFTFVSQICLQRFSAHARFRPQVLKTQREQNKVIHSIEKLLITF